TPYVIPLLVATAIMVWIGLYTLRFKDVPVARIFSLLMGLGAVWAFNQALDISSDSYAVKLFLTQFRVAENAFIAPVEFILVLVYTGRSAWLNRTRLGLIFAIPVATAILSMTSSFHKLFRYDFYLDISGPFPLLLKTNAAGYWIYLTYAYLTVMVAVVLLLLALRDRSLYTRRTLFILLGIIIPYVVEVLFTFGVTPIRGYSLTPTAFVLSGILYIWALLRYNLFSVAPLARSIVVENITDLVIVLDPDRRIVDFNPAAQVTIGLSSSSIGSGVDSLAPLWADLFQRFQQISDYKGEVAVGEGTAQRYYDLSISAIWENRERMAGRLFLLHDLTRRKQADEALRESEVRFRTLFEQAAVGVALIESKTGRYVRINQKYCDFLGYTMEEMLRLRFHDVTYPEGTRTRTDYNTLLIEGKIREFTIEKSYQRKDGQMVWGILSASPLWLPDEVPQVYYHIDVVQDISERKAAEKEIQRHAAHTEALAQTALTLNERMDEQVILQSVCEEAARTLNVPYAGVLILDEQRNELRLAANYGFPAQFDLQRIQPLKIGDYERFASHIGDAGIISDIQTIPDLDFSEFYSELDIHTMMITSMFHSQKLTGVVGVLTTGIERSFTPDELSLLKGLAAQAAQAVDNARLFNKVSVGQKHLRTLSQALVELRETERRSLALELHDELGQLLSSTKLSLDMIPSLPAAEASAQLSRAQALVGDMVGRVRRMALELRPSMLDDMGLLAALNWLFNDYRSRTGETVNFEQSGLEQRFSPQVEITAFRIIQEALTNVIRHAVNKQVNIKAWLDERAVNLQIVDHGVGFDPHLVLSERLSSGLSGMFERARLLGGELVIESSAGIGTTLTVNLPLNHEAEGS
ncbi:MAG: histidine kinase N-terminal 7TM domain-containing protein, partial [Chloroflexota bacterium]